MATIISADNGSVSGSAGLKSAADSSGVLQIQTGANVAAITVDAAQNTTFNSTGGVGLPQGTTAERPATPTNGMTRVNTTTNALEIYSGVIGLWSSIISLNATPSTVEYLVVAGGGGGGALGGGGAGGYRTISGFPVSSGTPITVTVGAGGVGGNTLNSPLHTNGSDSVFGSITSTGGGYGGNFGAPTAQSGAAGGSGGGGGGTDSGGTAGSGGAGNTPSTSPAQGTSGAAGTVLNSYSTGGGGGGASAAGAVGTSSSYGGQGGAGTASSITNSSVIYAGGGSGGGSISRSGGAGGGGAGGGANASGSNATANTGGGGGGGGNTSGQTGGAGGSGTVIVRYSNIYNAATSTTGSPTITVAGGYRVYQWTASGSITF